MKRIISMLLVCILLLQVVPTTGFAYESCSFSTFEELKELCAKTYSTQTRFTYTGTGDLVITQDLTLPENTIFDLYRTNVTVAKGATFRSNVSAFAKNWTINGTAHLYHTKVYDTFTANGKVYFTGALELEDDATSLDRTLDQVIVGMDNISFTGFHIDVRPDIDTFEELKSHLARAEATTDPLYRFVLFVLDDIVVSQSLTVPGNTILCAYGDNLTVSKGCTLTVNGRCEADYNLNIQGKLVNNGQINFVPTARLNVASGGTYSGRGQIWLYQDGKPEEIITGLDLDDFTIEKYEYGTRLYYTSGLTQLPEPTSLKWGKLENYDAWDNSSGSYIRKDIVAPGAISFRPNGVKAGNARVSIYHSNGSLFREFNFWFYADTEWISTPLFVLCDPASGSYYYTVTALGDNETYRNSETVKSPTFKYTKPSKKVGSCTNVSWEQDCYPSFSTPSSTTYVGGYEFEIYRAATKNGKQEYVGNPIYYDTKSVPDVSLMTNLLNVFGAGYYSYRVRAISSDITVRANGAWSEMSNAIYLAPLNVKTSNVASSGKIKVSWEKVSGAAEYQVYRATSQNGSYKLMKTTTGTSYTNTSAEAGTTYYYKVRAVTKDGVKMPFSAAVSRCCDLPRPVAKATTVASSGKIKLTWEAVSGAKEYKVYRATSEKGEYKLMKTTTGTSYTNTSAEAGKTYYYKVKAIHSKSDANSAYSEVVSKLSKLAKPKVDSTNVASSGKIKLTWEAVSGAKEYKVYRATSENGEYTLMKTTTGTSYTNTSATAGKKYYYKVKAIHSNASCNSGYSDVESRYCDLVRPDVSIALKSGDPRLTWDKISGAKEYQVYRATSKSGEYKKVKTTTGTSFTDTSATAGKTYYYKVKAIHSTSSANSAYSSVKSIKAK